MKGTALQWSESYLSSSQSKVSYGDPQGSVLGTLLQYLYYACLPVLKLLESTAYVFLDFL